ncbi:hypothetical protein [Vulcanisaeta sp. JCM 14467]|uniref:hypothetical protein n=1 Tax=Vulcanisaeta sp. JCM 14467 TaxID=1295370 RepID=UPI0006D00D04|nr:hypothetical protein [Vulcanisaeta sp. JCM 14467]
MRNDKQDEYRALRRLEKEISELGKLRLRARRLRVKQGVACDKDLVRFASSWAVKCIKPLRDYCWNTIIKLGRYFTPASINSILTKAQSRGLSIEVVIILLSQCDLKQCDDRLVRYYLDTGRVDTDQLLQILRGQGVSISPGELKAIIEGRYRTKEKGGLSIFQRLIKH